MADSIAQISNIAQNKQITEQNPNQQQWEIPPNLSWGAGVTGSTVLVFLAWLACDRLIKPRVYGWYSRLKRPYADLETISNILQTIRGETGAERALLMEMNSKRGTMIPLAQEVLNDGIGKIVFSPQDNQADCVRKILQRFNDDCFITRETDQISDAPQYQGFLNNYNTSYVIYYKLGEKDSTAWILALHFFYKSHVDYIAAVDLRESIIRNCSAMLYRLLQRSPVEGLIK